MVIIRTFHNNENSLNYLGTLSFLCAISCTIIMLRFRGFKATFNTSKKNKGNLIHYDESPGVSIIGAYRINKDEFLGGTSYPNPQKTITPSMVRLPAAQPGHRAEISKSTSNLAQPLKDNIKKTKSTPNIPEVVPKPLSKNEIKEQKKLEKKLLDEKKMQEKLAAKEQEKAERLKKEREKQLQKQKAEEEKKKSKIKAPKPQPEAKNVKATPEVATRSEIPEPTNTLESSISRSSGPPPYTPKEDIALVNNKSDPSGNTSFSPESDDSSWNMISQHRQQINRPVVVKALPKQTHMDLQYNVGPTDNSSA